MNDKIKKMLEITDNIHRPIPLDESEMAELRMAKKPVLESRLLDDMEDLSTWKTVTPYAEIALDDTHVKEGAHSLKFTAPTNLNGWNTDPHSHMYNVGRIYAVPAARRDFDREDWRAYNRLSAWVYPDCPGMKSVTLRIQLFNDGEVKVPDIFIRDGAHNMTLKDNCWNFVVLEMPYLDRDAVTGVAFEYDMVGHENDAVDKVTFYCDQLRLEKVEADVFEGWIPANDRISYSHSGYQPGATKSAVMSNTNAKTFRVIDAKTGIVVLKKEIEQKTTKVGTLQVMDFSEITTEGEYILVAGDLSTRTFPIAHDAWEDAVWKALNFYLVLRCGYEVPGKHRKCHSDMLMVHDGKSIVCDGGWHDAADLAQGFNNTCDSTRALLDLAASIKNTGNDALYARVLEEAKWGLDYVLKMRFGDGYRATYSSSSIWTDGVIGTHDDITMKASKTPLANFGATAAEANGYLAFIDTDKAYADYCLKIAKEDYVFAKEALAEASLNTKGKREVEVMIYSTAATAAAAMYRVTKEPAYKTDAKAYIEVVLACQEQEIMSDWSTPMTGFFYENRNRDIIWHHNHHAASCFPDMALREMCETFPDDADYGKWYYAIVLSSKYYAALMQFTDPYGCVPAGVFYADEVERLGDIVLAAHPTASEIMDTAPARYRRQVENGFKLSDNAYVRVYPVWFSFRGNYNVLLSEGKAMGSAAQVRNNYKLNDYAVKQYEWIVGKNPMAQSTMYGVGHDYIQLYAVQPGQTVGAISVGMESHFDNDEPYWPQVANATYKEVWIGSLLKWMWSMADNLTPATVSGYLPAAGGAPVTFQNKANGAVIEVYNHPRTGYYEVTLPAGEYVMCYEGKSRSITAIQGKHYEIDSACGLEVASCYKDGKLSVTLSTNSDGVLPVSFISENICGLGDVTVPANGSVTVEATLIDENKPYVGLALPNGDLSQKVEFVDARC